MWRHFPAKAVKIKKQKHPIVYNAKVYHPAKVCAQTDKNSKSSSRSECIFRRKADPEWFWYKKRTVTQAKLRASLKVILHGTIRNDDF